MARIRTVIFDLDGTLIDTEPAAARAVQECFDRWGIELKAEDSQFVTGRTWAVAVDYFFSRYPIPLPRAEATRQMLDQYREALERHLIVVPGSADAVASLSESFRLGLVSGSNRAEILWALRKLGVERHFSAILGAEDYLKSKPAPDGYIKALQLLGCEPGSCLIFEDSEPGVASALTAGAWVVAITSTNHFNQDTSRAHHRIADLTAINPEWIAKFEATLPVKHP